jgi:acyl-CoA-binding protein
MGVKKLLETGTGYFRIKAWDGLKGKTASEVRAFTIQ